MIQRSINESLCSAYDHSVSDITYMKEMQNRPKGHKSKKSSMIW